MEEGQNERKGQKIESEIDQSEQIKMIEKIVHVDEKECKDGRACTHGAC